MLPRARLPLHIFEPRYLAMLDDTFKTAHRMIGMIQPYEAPGGERLHSIGCAGRITAFSETDDGRYMITLAGIARFRVVSEVNGFTPYRRCDVDWTGFERDTGPSESDTTIEDKQALLEAPALATRRETVVTLIEFALRGGQGDEVMQ